MRSASLLRSLLCLLVLVGAAACVAEDGKGRSVEAALEQLRACVAAKDGAALFALYDRESRGYYEGRVREWQARLDRDDPPSEVFDGTGVAPEVVRDRPLEEAVVDFASRRAPLFEASTWLAGAKVIGRDADPDDADQVRFRLRGPDGAERDLWFVREGDGWSFDHYRTDYVR